MSKKLRFYISPYFVIKYYLVKDIQYIIKRYNLSGNLLDVGCGSKPYRSLFSNIKKYRGIDFKDYSVNKDFSIGKPDYYFRNDYSKTLVLPFKNESFDNAVSFQVLEHHNNPATMLNELLRVIKSGGYVMISYPFLAGIHEAPKDYQRLTEFGLRKILKGKKCKLMEIKRQGSVFSVISNIANEHLNNFASRNKHFFFIAIIIYLPFLLFQYLSLVLDKIIISDKIFINYLLLIKKL